jgi:hypothetical protein
MRTKVDRAVAISALRFKRYVSWGEFVQMLKSGQLVPSDKFYHKSCHSGYIYSTFDNPFGPEGEKILGPNGGVESDPEVVAQERADWNQKFKHATDFIMLASEETIIKLLHNLEASVDAYVEKAEVARQKAEAKEEEYVKWLKSQGARHDYRDR